MSGEKRAVAFRVPNDTYDRLQDYQEKHDVNQSTAGRRLLERSLNSTNETRERSSERSSHLRDSLVSFASTATAVALFATIATLVSPGLLDVWVLFWFWAAAAASNAVVVLGDRWNWFTFDGDQRGEDHE